ncbi:MAG: HD family phosphohydrolase [Tenericutes bacterium]|nr:HD family phosphohydrolase [Mycoplasmatota bacterium]
MKNKKEYYNIYSEFNNINKYRALKTILHHGNNRLSHIDRVAKLSFFVSKNIGVDYISCTRGAMMHDFFTTEDISKNDNNYNQFLKKHPLEALNNSKEFFDVNDIEKDIILSHMYPITSEKPKYIESKIVCTCDKVVSLYEFFRYEIKASINMAYVYWVRFMSL